MTLAVNLGAVGRSTSGRRTGAALSTNHSQPGLSALNLAASPLHNSIRHIVGLTLAVNLGVGRSRGPGTTPEHVLASPYLLLGSINQIIEQLQRLRELFGISYFVVGDESMETFAPVVAQLIGK